MSNYDRFDVEIDQNEMEMPSKEEIRKEGIKRLVEINKELRPFEMQKRAICVALSNPETKQECIDLTTKAVSNITKHEVTEENMYDVPFHGWSEEDRSKFDLTKNKPIYGLHEGVIKTQEVLEGIEKLKVEGKLDGRRIRHKKKPGDYVNNVALHKLIADNAKRTKELQEFVAKLAIFAVETRDIVSQVQDKVVTFEDKIKGLEYLGISPKKLEAYIMLENDKSLTIDDVALKLNKNRATIFRWMKEIKKLEENVTDL